LKYLEKVIEETKKKAPKDKFIVTIYIDSSSEDPTKKLTPKELKEVAEFFKKINEEGHIVNIISVLKPEEPKTLEEIEKLSPTEPNPIVEHCDTVEELEEVTKELIE